MQRTTAPGKTPASAVEAILLPRTSDIGHMEVKRALPHPERRLIGPFIFWDQMGPGEFLAGQGMDVRPHPHIGLSTVSYLFEGSMDHKDSLGTDIRIHPGDVNLMTAGQGIVHSERSGQDVRQAPSRLFGIQSWLAQPRAKEESEPAFQHVPKQDLPVFEDGGLRGRVILGAFQGLVSPVPLDWETLYVDCELAAGAALDFPAAVEERALYLLEGELRLDGQDCPIGALVVLRPGRAVRLSATTRCRVLLLGGAPLDGPRYIWWNLVASSRDLIVAAAERWQARGFPLIPNDAEEFIPLPDMPRLAEYP